MRRWSCRVCVAALLSLGLAAPLAGQYFGQNKVRYKNLNFEVLKTAHFDIYYYPQEAALARLEARMAERWYARFASLLHHQLSSRQPLILYASHTDFEQTNVVPGFIPASVGGVTLSLGRKVVVPAAGTLRETDHVLGHELVHAFQYDMSPRGREGSGLGALPGWFVEGMAEYLSVGPDSAQTSMWLRDAVARKAMPTIRDLNNPRKYFPYRFGHAFWAYVGGRYGDQRIGPMLTAAMRGGPNAALRVLNVSPEQLSVEWLKAAEAADRPVIEATAMPPEATVLIPVKKPFGASNVSPALSADGRWVMFYSERSVYAANLYLANAQTGQIVRRITSTALDPEYDNLDFINSAGAWSPAGDRFAYCHVQGATAMISIYDLQANRVVANYRLPRLGEAFSPSWSPDGRELAFSAIAGGFTNLYVLQVATGAVRQLTDGEFGALQPAWSPDGREIAFVTDRFTSRLADLSWGRYQLALMPAAGGAIEPVRTGLGGNQTDPQWTPGGRGLDCLSDASGIPNIYHLDLASGVATALTNLRSGVSGITPLSPAFSVAARTGAIVYSAYTDGGYELVRWAAGAGVAAAAPAVARLHPALLPPRQASGGEVAIYLGDPKRGLPDAAAVARFTTQPYRPRLSLNAIAPPSFGVGISPFGTLVGGGTALEFGDMLNYRSLTIGIESLATYGGNDFLRNLSVQGIYANQRHRWTWGVAGGQSPYVSSAFSTGVATVNGAPVLVDQFLTVWETDRQAVGLLVYPFNRAQRLELSGGYENIGFAAEQEVQFVDPVTGVILGDQRQDVGAAPDLNMAIASAALVYDTSLFGGASPMDGQSYRVQAGFSAGTLDYATGLADYRRYVSLARPFSLAGRILQYGRYGSGADDRRLQPLYLGYPSLVRGYDAGSFSAAECGPTLQTTGACPVFDRLLGSKIAVVNLEARLELMGPLGVFLTPSVPPVELAPFLDAGTAWTSADRPDFLGGNRRPVSSEGVTLRVNLFGAAVASISAAFPNNRPGQGAVWEFAFLPGF